MTTLQPTAVIPADRGQLVVAAKVIEKTAIFVAAKVPGIGVPLGALRGSGNRGEKANFNAAPKIAVHLDGSRAYLELEAAVEYPRPLGETTEELRTRLMRDVTAMTGVQVTRVDIRVTRIARQLHQPRSIR